MMMRKAFLLVVATLPLALAAAAAAENEEQTLFGNVVKALSERYYDEAFRRDVLPEFVNLYSERAALTASFEEHRELVHEFLSNIPASHLALISAESRERMMNELTGRPAPSFGFELIEYDGKQYAFNVLEEGPAAKAGLRRGDRIITVNGVLVDDSPLLGWRTDDAFLPDPPVRSLHGGQGDRLALRIERTPGEYVDLGIPCELYSAWEATQASVRVIERAGKRLGVIHYWLIQLRGPDTLLKETLEGEFASCDALVLDLRGRGGSGTMVALMLDVLEGKTSAWNKPVVALINGHSRSAKEAIAYEFRRRDLGLLVGEHTAGAVIPASMTDVGFGMHLMFPTFTLPKFTDALEFKGVEPDVFVAEVGPYSAGADPILEAGLDEAVRLADSASWKARREQRQAVNSDKGDSLSAVPCAASPGGVSARSTHAMLKPSSVQTAALSVEDPAGYDSEALQILQRMIDALGGESALRRHTAKAIRGKRNIGGMIDGTFEVLKAAPNCLVRRTILPGMGRMEVGFNGSVGWEVSPHDGANLMSAEDMKDMIVDADFYAELNYKKNHRSIRYVGQTEFAGKPCHEVRLTKPSGTVEVQYIEARTYLPIGSVGTVKTNMGPMMMTRTVTEFQVFDGEKIPTKYMEDVGGIQNMTTTVTDVSFAPLAAETFDPPKDVVATIEK